MDEFLPRCYRCNRLATEEDHLGVALCQDFPHCEHKRLGIDWPKCPKCGNILEMGVCPDCVHEPKSRI